MGARVRVQKALADAGVASRRSADALVAEGRVSINGDVAAVGQRVDPERDTILVDGRRLESAASRVYLALAKPAGVTSTVNDRHAGRTVLDLVPPELRRATRLYPVGRLDRESEGLILITNDGEWAQRVLHPRHGVEREYAVGVARPLERAQAERLHSGVELEEGNATLVGLREMTGTEKRKLGELIGRDASRLAWYRATLTQGWKRQLRRMFAAVDAPVARLVRVRIGTLRLDDLRLGEVRELSARERAHLAAPAQIDR